MTNTKKIVFSAIFLILGLVIPQAFHYLPIANTGSILLPMHIPVLLCGFLLGPLYGALVGILTPAFSFLITGMPPIQIMPFMVIELFAYGLVAGIMFSILKKANKMVRIYISLIVAMILGRMVYAMSLFFATNLLGLSKIGPIAAINGFVKGVPGIIIQLVIIPPLVYQVRKSRLFDNN